MLYFLQYSEFIFDVKKRYTIPVYQTITSFEVFNKKNYILHLNIQHKLLLLVAVLGTGVLLYDMA